MSRAVETPAVPKVSPLAGQPAPKEMLIDVARLEREYLRAPAGPERPQPVGQLRHQRTPRLAAQWTFTEAHILAITQAICDYRRAHGTDGPLYMGKDTHAALRSGAAHRARGAGGQRRGDHHSAKQRRDADAGHLAGHPRLQPRPQGSISPTASSSRRRTTRRRTAGSSTTRQRRSRRHGRHASGWRTGPTNCSAQATPA